MRRNTNLSEQENQEPLGLDQLSQDLASIQLPNFHDWEIKDLYDREKFVVDYTDFEKLEECMAEVRKVLFILNDKINYYERKERKTKKAHERAERRYYLNSNAKTEGLKRERARQQCEQLENQYMVNEQLKQEFLRTSYLFQQELKTLQTIAYNLKMQR